MLSRMEQRKRPPPLSIFLTLCLITPFLTSPFRIMYSGYSSSLAISVELFHKGFLHRDLETKRKINRHKEAGVSYDCRLLLGL